MTASNDRRPRSRTRAAIGSRRLRFLRVVFGVILLAPALLTASPVPVTKADDLSDAIAEQQRLTQLIAKQKAQLAKLQTQQVSLTKQISSTQQNLSGVLTSLDAAQAQVDDVDAQLTVARARYGSLAGQQSLLDAQLAEIVAERDAKQSELERRRQILASRLVEAYITDQTPLAQQILTAQSLTEAMSDVSYYSDMAEADRALAEQIQADEADLAQLERNVAVAADAARQLADQAAAEKTTLDVQSQQLAASKAQLEDLKKQLEDQLASYQATQSKLARNKAALDATIASNGKALDDLGTKIDKYIREEGGYGRIPSVYNGTFKWPMSGVITQEFGCTGVASEPRVGSCAHFHQGIDIAAPCLTPVYAAGAGTVVFVDYNPYDAPPRAWLVIIAHSTSLVTWYAHMQGKAPAGIHVGAHVAQGQLVGLEASTGHSTGCHLHWAVRVNGVFTNPRLFL
jgi:murein DD-endopeptidase MepM/ murein hydrolase activator NlpD